MAEKVTFISHKPYLTLNLSKNGYMVVNFSEDQTFKTDKPYLIQLLRDYAEEHKGSYNIVEAGQGIDADELSNLNAEFWEKEIEKAEQRELIKQEHDADMQREQDLIDALKSRF